VTRLLITGKSGQVGWELQRSLQCLGEVVAVDREQFDLAQPETLAARLDEISPDVIVNAAAYTAVDKAESDEALATTVNGDAPTELARWAVRRSAMLVHYSTDYVFDGGSGHPYSEDAATCPVNAYGRSKLVGEAGIRDSGCDHLVVRTTWCAWLTTRLAPPPGHAASPTSPDTSWHGPSSIDGPRVFAPPW